MPDFASILDCIEHENAGRASSRPTASRFRAHLAEMGARTTSAAREAFAAYAANGTGEEIVSSPRPVDAAALRLAILAAGGDARELRALRRLAARALHPDRGGDGAALADCNALIDAALRTSRNKT